MPDTSLFSALKLGPPEYVFFIVLFGGALVAFNRKWIYSLTPVGRLYNLRREIRDLYALMGPLDFDDLHGRQKDKAIRLCRKLDKLSNVNYFVRLASIMMAAFSVSLFHCSVASVDNYLLPV